MHPAPTGNTQLISIQEFPVKTERNTVKYLLHIDSQANFRILITELFIYNGCNASNITNCNAGNLLFDSLAAKLSNHDYKG